MMANAIGPQNTVGAIGIRPSTVEIAVRIIGRRREVAEASTASCTLLPSARSVSICTIRITAFFAIMPISARMPRIATKPSGRLNTSSASTTPIRPSGSMATTMASRRKLTSMHHHDREHQHDHQRHDREHRGAGDRALLVQAAGGDLVVAAAAWRRTRRSSARARRPRCRAARRGVTSARTVSVGTRSRRQTSGNSCSSTNVANCCSGTMRPLGVGTCSELKVSNEARWSSVARATTLTR